MLAAAEAKQPVAPLSLSLSAHSQRLLKVLKELWRFFFKRDVEVVSGSDSSGPDGAIWKEIKVEGPRRGDNLRRRRRQKSETFRAQYSYTKGLEICAATWNVGAKVPPHDLDIKDWLEVSKQADIYVISFQELVPLDADINSPEVKDVPSRWENIIQKNLNGPETTNNIFKSFSEPPSPSRSKPSDDGRYILEYEFNSGDVSPVNEESKCKQVVSNEKVIAQDEVSASSEDTNIGRLSRLSLQGQLRTDSSSTCDSEENGEPLVCQNKSTSTKNLSDTEKVYLNRSESPPDQLSVDFCRSQKKGRLRSQKKGRLYIKLLSKQMRGLFFTIWVCSSLRRHIQNIDVSVVGVLVKGIKSKKGSISVSMSIHQTFFCFVCAHLKAGERVVDAAERISEVNEIQSKTRFNSDSRVQLPKTIFDHERIIWFGDLNFRINLSYDKTIELISKKEWSKLLENDQLNLEKQSGKLFCGWAEGTINFAPTYRYEINSDEYVADGSKLGKRTPACKLFVRCDRILSFGKGISQMNYRRSELRLSDHRPVSASYTMEVDADLSKLVIQGL